MVPLPFSRKRCTHYSNTLHDFLVTVPLCYNNFYVKSLCPCTSRLRNSFPLKYFSFESSSKCPFSLKLISTFTVQKIKFSIKDFFSICDQIRSFLRIWSHLLKKSLIENIIFLQRFHLGPFKIIFHIFFSPTSSSCKF